MNSTLKTSDCDIMRNQETDMSKALATYNCRSFSWSANWLQPALFIIAYGVLACLPVQAAVKKSVSELEFGTVLFEYHQERYFDALVEYEYNRAVGNKNALSADGKVLQGGMMVSYGMLDPAYNIFSELLEGSREQVERNRAWYHLGNFYYSKSNKNQAIASLNKISGDLDDKTLVAYLNLASLLSLSTDHVVPPEKILASVPARSVYRNYLQFNLAISKLQNNDIDGAIKLMEKVASYSGSEKERAALADRARHGLSQIAIQRGQQKQAWKYLTGVRTNGLYSNRALLSYAWAAIKLERYTDAIPALELLNSRPIVTSEVQEAKVLLLHLHEQRGATRDALEAGVQAEKEYQKGIALAQEAKSIITEEAIIQDFIINFGQLTNRSDWYGASPEIDYQSITPFLLDLVVSHTFNELLKELADLYAIRANLSNWDQQAEQHLFILESSSKKVFATNLQNKLVKSQEIRNALETHQQQLRMMSKKDQKRMRAVVASLEQDLENVDEKISVLQGAEPYQPKGNMQQLVNTRHREIRTQLKRTQDYIAVLEPVMRDLINEELNRHIERMRHYSSQARLAKARLYDAALLELDQSDAGGQ